jgi:hypothetical protein
LPILMLYIVGDFADEKVRWLKRTIPMWGATLLVIGLIVYVRSDNPSYLTIDWHALPRFWEILLTYIGPDVVYLKQVWLDGQAYLLPFWLAVLLLVPGGFVLWQLPPIYRLGVIWMTVLTLPTVFIVYQTSRYYYVPLVGLGIILGQGVCDLAAYLQSRARGFGRLLIPLGLVVVLGYAILGIQFEEQDYHFYGEVHRQAVQSIRRDILPYLPADGSQIAVFVKPGGRVWEARLYAQFLLKPWFVPVTYKWVYTRPFSILGGLASTCGLMSYGAYVEGQQALFAVASRATFQQAMRAGHFVPIVHDYAPNTFHIGNAALKTELQGRLSEPGFYQYLQPGQFDPTARGAQYW